MLSAESATTAATERIVEIGEREMVGDWVVGVVVVDSPKLIKVYESSCVESMMNGCKCVV